MYLGGVICGAGIFAYFAVDLLRRVLLALRGERAVATLINVHQTSRAGRRGAAVYEATAQWQDKNGGLRSDTVRSHILVPGAVMREDIFYNKRRMILADDDSPLGAALLGMLLGGAILTAAILEWLGMI